MIGDHLLVRVNISITLVKNLFTSGTTSLASSVIGRHSSILKFESFFFTIPLRFCGHILFRRITHLPEVRGVRNTQTNLPAMTRVIDVFDERGVKPTLVSVDH